MSAYSCTVCDWRGDEPSTTHEKVVRDGDGGLEVAHTFRPICPKCFNHVRSGAP